MERILHYEIKASDDSPTVACFLKRQGYSSANLTDLKKMPESILMLITSILLLCIIAMGLYQLLQFAEHCYKKKV